MHNLKKTKQKEMMKTSFSVDLIATILFHINYSTRK